MTRAITQSTTLLVHRFLAEHASNDQTVTINSQQGTEKGKPYLWVPRRCSRLLAAVLGQ